MLTLQPYSSFCSFFPRFPLCIHLSVKPEANPENNRQPLLWLAISQTIQYGPTTGRNGGGGLVPNCRDHILVEFIYFAPVGHSPFAKPQPTSATVRGEEFIFRLSTSESIRLEEQERMCKKKGDYGVVVCVKESAIEPIESLIKSGI